MPVDCGNQICKHTTQLVVCARQTGCQGKDPYITDDEDRLTEVAVSQISSRLRTIETRSYFNAFVTRIFPEKYTWMSKVDRMLLNIWTPMAQLPGSRMLMGGVIAKGHE